MKQLAVVIALGAAMAVQTGSQRFVGAWSADHDGLPVVRLELRVNDGALAGTIRLADIHLDTRGDVDTVLSGLSPARPLLDVSLRNATLAFGRRDGNDVDHFEVNVIDETAAELRFLPSEEDRRELADSGIPMPRPIRLTRSPR